MIAIRLMFPAGRYHATPWGRHVNEGVAEWPPSPYRLLRALYDVWKRKCQQVEEADVREALEALAAAPPRFHLPAAVATHTRSYLSANAKDPSDKNLVFDPFLVFDRPQACYLVWQEAECGAAPRRVLNLLLENLNYLGRSESWVQAGLWDGPIEADYEVSVAEAALPDHESANVACAVPASEFQGRQSWMEALTFSTANLLKERASSPPLLRQVRYSIPKRAVSTDPPRMAARRQPTAQAVMLGLDATVLPLVTVTLEVAEQVRMRLMGAHRRRMDGDASRVSPLFSGKQPDGRKRMDHGHVYILPLANRDGQRIDRILIVSPLRVFDEDELDAVRGVRELYQRDGRPTVQCVLTWQGGREEIPGLKLRRTAISATPFVPPRHWRKGRDRWKFIEDEVRRECANHGVAGKVAGIEPRRELPSKFDVVEYRRNRKQDPVRPGYALKVTFEEEVPAPFAIGYGAHFGLGQFQAEE